MAKKNQEWVKAIAERANAEASAVETLLATHGIRPTPVLPSARRLQIAEIAFSGVKDGVGSAGSFAFEWKDLGHGLWAMLTDENLRGKSSIIEVVRWLLRGRASEYLQVDVRRWIHKARLRFLVDDVVHEVHTNTIGSTTGQLLRLVSNASRPTVVGRFGSDAEFEAVMADFFMQQLGMETIMSWREGKEPQASGQAIAHGWIALSGAMFIGTNYEVLLGDMPVAAGLNARLMQMYVGLPWVSTLAAAKTALHTVQNAFDSNVRRAEKAREVRGGRVTQIKAELAARRSELGELPSDEAIRRALAELNTRYANEKRKERALEEKLTREVSARRQAESAYQDDRRSLQTHLDAMAAGAIFRMLDPVCCPRCDHAIDDARKATEQKSHACSVCGETIVTNEDAELIREELEKRVKASKAAFNKGSASCDATTNEIAGVNSAIESIQVEIDRNTDLLGQFERRRQIENDIAVLEGRLAEAESDIQTPAGGDSSQRDLTILTAAVTETESRVKDLRETIFTDISVRLVAYARCFGMHSLSEATLKSNATLALTKGGVETSYSKVTEGEKLRLKVATILAIIEAAEKIGVGRHPGLLMIDSPAAQEVSPHDVAELVAGLRSVSTEITHLQVFVAGISSPAITASIPTENRREAIDGGFLW